MKPIYITELSDFELVERRDMFDIYRLDADRFIYLATDRFYLNGRLAAQPIPGKGIWFTQIAMLAFCKCAHFLNSIYDPVAQTLPEKFHRFRPLFHERFIVAPATRSIDVKCIVLATVGDTAWDEFTEQGSIAGIPVPMEIEKGHALPFPIFASKILRDGKESKRYSTFEELKEAVGPGVAQFLQDKSIETFIFAVRLLEEKGIVLHSCTFEYGFLGDQVLMSSFPLTPDNATLSLRKGLGVSAEEACLDDRLAAHLLQDDDIFVDPDKPLYLPDDVISRLNYVYEQYSRMFYKDETQRPSGL